MSNYLLFNFSIMEKMLTLADQLILHEALMGHASEQKVHLL